MRIGTRCLPAPSPVIRTHTFQLSPVSSLEHVGENPNAAWIFALGGEIDLVLLVALIAD